MSAPQRRELNYKSVSLPFSICHKLCSIDRLFRPISIRCRRNSGSILIDVPREEAGALVYFALCESLSRSSLKLSQVKPERMTATNREKATNQPRVRERDDMELCWLLSVACNWTNVLLVDFLQPLHEGSQALRIVAMQSSPSVGQSLPFRWRFSSCPRRGIEIALGHGLSEVTKSGGGGGANEIVRPTRA